MSESLVATTPIFSPAVFRRSLGDALEMAHGVDAVAAASDLAAIDRR